MSQAELKAIGNLSIKDRVKKWKTFTQCCYGAGVRATRKEVKKFANKEGKAWDFYKEVVGDIK
jgi:hypothetical protein